MSNQVPKRTFRVRFHSEENGSYVELWQLVGQKKFIARHTHGPKSWCYVSDPFGYREPDSNIEDDATIIVCDKKGNELFHTNNADGSADFNTPKQEAYAQWAEYAKPIILRIGKNSKLPPMSVCPSWTSAATSPATNAHRPTMIRERTTKTISTASSAETQPVRATGKINRRQTRNDR